MRKPLSKGQKGYFPLIGGTFVLKIGLPVLETKITDHCSIQIYPQLVGNMASETTFDHWKVFFSWGKVRKRALNQKAPVPDVQIFFGDSWGNFPKNGTNPRPGQFFGGFQPYKSLWTLAERKAYFTWGYLSSLRNLVKHSAAISEKTWSWASVYLYARVLICHILTSRDCT